MAYKHLLIALLGEGSRFWWRCLWLVPRVGLFGNDELQEHAWRTSKTRSSKPTAIREPWWPMRVVCLSGYSARAFWADLSLVSTLRGTTGSWSREGLERGWENAGRSPESSATIMHISFSLSLCIVFWVCCVVASIERLPRTVHKTSVGEPIH